MCTACCNSLPSDSPGCPLPLPPLPQNMSVPQLIDTILINPTVSVAPSYRDTGATAQTAAAPS